MATYEQMQEQIEEALRKPEIDALIVNIAAAQTSAEVALLLAHFIKFERVIVATQDKVKA